MFEKIYEPDEDSFLLWNSFIEELEKTFNLKFDSRSRNNNSEFLKKFSLLDMGSGSGYLGIEAGKIGFKKITLADINQKSIDHIKNIILSEELPFEAIQTDLFKNIKKKFDFILFNTPYLPNEENEQFNDLALNGGPMGNEVALRFIEDLDKHLSSEGFALLLISSLSKPEIIEKKLSEKKFLHRIVKRKKLFFEELIIIKITKQTNNDLNISNADLVLLRKYIPSYCQEIELFSKGKRGLIFKAKTKNQKVIIKIPLIRSDSKNSSFLEGTYLEKVNKLNIGPRLIDFGDNFVVMEFIEGKNIDTFLKSATEKDIRIVLKKIFHQLVMLDSKGINKFELTNPYKHIIIKQNNEPVLIDWERSRFVKRTKNVTQFSEYLMSKQILNLLQKKGLLKKPEIFKEIIKKYSMDKSIKINLDELNKII